ncbi:MAG: 4-(cytidine 5'-diphospho)-2-C-methyl-D-erythritol kinase [Candidatus Edwardsbacteria bacterium]|nr:4-(cytidine 5'-diphospho)-2-C-methyl-D-erythritol kinase [Candidatus Edwardsbacteria bacterium]
MMGTIKAKACAKINLTLEILGKRPDGYHDIRSLFLAVSLADELAFTPRGDGRIVLDADDPHLPVDRRNLIVKAAYLLKDEYSVPAGAGANIELRKNIPVGAGLGGGSSDAASALLSLKKLWDIDDASVDDLAAIGAKIGSDVPFFIRAKSALVTGRGEIIEPLDIRRIYHFVIAFPGFPVSTAWVYKNLKIDLTKRPEYSNILLSHCLNGEEPDKLATFFYNDFEPSVIRSHSRIADVKTDLLRSGALGTLMTGSGSSVFGIYPDQNAARSGLLQVRTAWPRSFAVCSVL